MKKYILVLLLFSGSLKAGDWLKTFGFGKQDTPQDDVERGRKVAALATKNPLSFREWSRRKNYKKEEGFLVVFDETTMVDEEGFEVVPNQGNEIITTHVDSLDEIASSGKDHLGDELCEVPVPAFQRTRINGQEVVLSKSGIPRAVEQDDVVLVEESPPSITKQRSGREVAVLEQPRFLRQQSTVADEAKLNSARLDGDNDINYKNIQDCCFGFLTWIGVIDRSKSTKLS